MTVPVLPNEPIVNAEVLAPSLITPFIFSVVPVAVLKNDGVVTPKVTAPLMMPVPVLLVIVPPLMLIALAKVLPTKSKVPAALIVNAPVPNGPEITLPVVGVELAPALKMPPLIIVPPVNVLGPDKVSVPMVKTNLPPAPLITPL